MPLAQPFHQADPGGALLSYILIGLMVYFLVTSLGELAAFMPVSDSLRHLQTGRIMLKKASASRWSWNYWYNWAVTIAVDLV
ncbi:hypothetical protein MJ588_19800 [Klebsiella pneumoniae]|nr:hypothetical protein MJ588_19800 [Klebsiella pneumoniae]